MICNKQLCNIPKQAQENNEETPLTPLELLIELLS